MAEDAGSIFSSVRIKLNELNADILACETAFDKLGGNIAAMSSNYSNITGKQYFAALKKIQTEIDNINAATKTGALTEQQAINRLIDLRKKELEILQKRAISEAGSNKETIAAIQNSQKALTALTEKQKLLGGETEKTGIITEKLRGLLTFAGATAAITAIAGAMKQCVEQFSTAQVSAQRLDLALKLNNMEDARKGLYALADGLQNLAGIDGDYVRQLEAELVAQGRSEQQIKDLITAAAGLSSVTGDDLATSLEQLNKMYEGVAPRSSALKAITDNLTEAQLRNGEGVKIVREKYEGYIGQVGTMQTANNKLKESFGDFMESVGSRAEEFQQIIDFYAKGFKNLSKVLDEATKEEKITRLITPMLEERTNLTKLAKDMAKSGITWGDVVESLTKKYEKLQATQKAFGKSADLSPEINQTLSLLSYARDMSAKEAEAAEALQKKAEAAKKTTGQTKELTDAQKEYNAAITTSLQNQKETGDVEAGLKERISLTKKYIRTLIELKAPTDAAKKALAGYEYQLATLSNAKSLEKIRDDIDKLTLSSAALKEKQREQQIEAIENAGKEKDGHEEVIRALREQWAIEDEIQAKQEKSKAIDGLETQIEKIKDLKDKTKDYLETERTRLLMVAEASGATGTQLEYLEDKINKIFDALSDSKGPKTFQENMKSIADVADAVVDYMGDMLSAIDDLIQQSYDAQIEAAESAAEARQEALEEAQDAQREALDAEAEHALELIEYDGLTYEQYLQKRVDDAKAAGDAEALAEAEKDLKKYQAQEEYEKKKADLEKRQAEERARLEKQAAYDAKMLEYEAALAAWKINLAMAIAQAALATVKAVASMPDPVSMTIAGIAIGALGAIQVGVIANNKPAKPTLEAATGGLVPPRYGGTAVTVAENGAGELLLNNSAQGAAMMRDFARAIVAEMGGGGGQTIRVPVYLDQRQIAEAVAESINNGQVAIR